MVVFGLAVILHISMVRDASPYLFAASSLIQPATVILTVFHSTTLYRYYQSVRWSERRLKLRIRYAACLMCYITRLLMHPS